MTLPHSSNIKTTFTAVALLWAATACDKYPLHDLGYTNGGLSGSDDDPDEPLPPVAEFGADFAGIWIGEAEDPLALRSNADDSPPSYRFPSGSRRIRLELTPAESGLFSAATIRFGRGTPPPPATDPNVGYPVDPDFDINSLGSLDRTVRPPVEGFTYSLGAQEFGALRDVEAGGITTPLEVQEFLDEGRVLDGTLRVSYTTNELFGSWCALQTPETCSAKRGSFTDDNNICFHGDDPFPTDCQKMVQCELNTCYCEEGYCTYSPDQYATLAIRLSDDGLVGLFSGAVFVNERGLQQPLGTVHFRREAP